MTTARPHGARKTGTPPRFNACSTLRPRDPIASDFERPDPVKLLLFLGYIITGSIDPAPKCKGGGFCTQRPMSYSATFFISLLLAVVILRLTTFPHGTN